MNLYIDTNIYLDFFSLSNDDIEELKKILLLIKSNTLKIYLPKQTENEFYRNREKIITCAIAHIKDQKLSGKFPQIAKSFSQFKEMIDAQKKFEKNKSEIISKIQEEAKVFSLNVDILIKELFELCERIDSNEELEKKAKNRYDLRNPPGKGNSYGDALNWISLLENCKEKEDLYLISNDGDYHSVLDNSNIHYFLKDEWSTLKKSEIHYYKSLSAFLRIHFPEIKLADEFEKELIINELSKTKSFAEAKENLRKLNKFQNFTKDQLENIINVVISNNQFTWISGDWGVGDILNSIVANNKKNIDKNLLNEFYRVYSPNLMIETVNDDLPF